MKPEERADGWYIVDATTGETMAGPYSSLDQVKQAADLVGIKLEGVEEEKPVTPWKGASTSRLAELYEEGGISADDYRTELQSRGWGEAAINDALGTVGPTINADTSKAGGQIAAGIAGTLGNILEGAENIARSATNRIPPDTSIAGAVNGVKTGAWSAEEAYQYMALGGLTPAQIQSAFTTRGVQAPTPGAPAQGSTADGAPTGSGGGSGGGAGTAAPMSFEDMVKAAVASGAMTPEQGRAALYDAGIRTANDKVKEYAEALGVRLFPGQKPGTGFYYDAMGRQVPIAYVESRGRVEAGTPVSGNNTASGPGGFSAITNPARARTVQDLITGSGRFEVSPEQAAVVANLGPIDGGRYLQEQLGLDHFPTLAEVNALIGTSVGGRNVSGLSPEQLMSLTGGPALPGGGGARGSQARERFAEVAARVFPNDPVRQQQYVEANMASRNIAIATDTAPAGVNATLNEFGQPVDANGELVSGPVDLTPAALDAGYTVKLINGLWYIIGPDGEPIGQGYNSRQEALARMGVVAYQTGLQRNEDRAARLAGDFTRPSQTPGGINTGRVTRSAALPFAEQSNSIGNINPYHTPAEPISVSQWQQPDPAIETPGRPIPLPAPYTGPVIYQPPFPGAAQTQTQAQPLEPIPAATTTPVSPIPQVQPLAPVFPERRRRRRDPLDELARRVA